MKKILILLLTLALGAVLLLRTGGKGTRGEKQ